MKHVKITSTRDAGGTVEVDGEDVSDRIHGLRLTAGAGQVPVVLFELGPRAVEFEGDAVVEVLNPEHDRRVLVEFLRDVDPKWLEEAMLSDDFSRGPAEGAIAALVKKAQDEYGA